MCRDFSCSCYNKPGRCLQGGGGVVTICHQCYQNWNSCSKGVKNKRTEEFCVAAVMPELWDKTKGEERKSIEDSQREDLELKLIIDF